MQSKRIKENIFQVLKFSLVGILNTAVDYIGFYIFFAWVGLDKNIAQILATGIAMANSYLCNRYWTFHQTGGIRADEIGKFIVVNLISMLVTILCLNVFYDVLHIEQVANHLFALLGLSWRFVGDASVMLAKLAAVPFSLAVNFLGNRLWVFAKQTKEK